jgi:hypothetical protein
VTQTKQPPVNPGRFTNLEKLALVTHASLGIDHVSAIELAHQSAKLSERQGQHWID